MALRFTQRDFLGLREEMINFMSEKLGDKWSDYSESDETMTLIELLAHCVSNLHFAYDNQKRETDIVTASFPRNVYAHAIRNGYKPSLFKAGKTWLNIDLRKKISGEITSEYTSLPVSIVIPRYTQIKNQEGDICVTNREFILPAGTSHFSIEVLGGEYAFEQFTKNDITEFNYVSLNRLNIAYETTRLFYQNEEWTPVVDVFTDIRDKKIYSLEPNFIRSGVRNIIRFFSTWKNDITDSSNITLEYIQTMGANSNYEKDTFTSFLDKNDLSNNTVKFDDDIFDSSGNPLSSWEDVEISFSQPKPFVNGQNFESIEAIKKSYLQSLRQTTSLVVLDDYYAFITLSGVKDFYVTDWNKNKTEKITIEYPRDIKALKAEEDEEGHSIYSVLNTYPENYWDTEVSYINSVDSITSTRKINGREIIIYKSFDTDVNDYSEYSGQHWYEEWLRASQLKSGFNSYGEIIPSIYIASPNRVKNTETDPPVLYENYDNAIKFSDTRSVLKTIEGTAISNFEDLNKLRIAITNRYHTDGVDYYNKILCAKYLDLVGLSEDFNFNSSTSFCSNVFKSYYKQNEVTAIPFAIPPSFYNQTEKFDCNIADVNFSSKNKIYDDKFKEELQYYYGADFTNTMDENEVIIKKTLINKINSISIKIDGIEAPFYVPSSEWFDCFLIIDGDSYTLDEEDAIHPYKHCIFESPETVYNKVGYFSSRPVEDYISYDEETDINGLPVIKLFNTPEEKESGTGYLNLYNKIALCFRKKTVDLYPSIGFGYNIQQSSGIIHQSESEVFYSDLYDNRYYIQENNNVYAPCVSEMPESDKKNTSLYALKSIIPNVYLKPINPENASVYDANYEYYSEAKKAYKIIHLDESGLPLVSAYDELYHDDFIFDKEHLTAKPLNIHYYHQLLKQTGGIINDSTSLIYIEEYLVDYYREYSYSKYPTPTLDINNEYTSGNSRFGFLRTGRSIVGSHKYDYKSRPCDIGLDDVKPDALREEHIKNSFLIDIQLTYPRYLKFLILKVCFVYDVDYTMTHEQLNKKLLSLGYDNILYALNKIINATFSISYWYTDKESTIGKQYTFSPNENKRFLSCGGTTSWDEDSSPSKNYFHWNIVYPEIIELYQTIQSKQGRGDAVFILPYERSGLDIHAHIYIQDSTADVSTVFENIWDAIVNYLGLLKNIEDIKYISEIISVIQSSDNNILKICTVNESAYSGSYTVITPDNSNENESIYITDVSKSSVVDFYHFLKFIPKTDIMPETNLGHALVLGNVCIRLQKKSDIENIVYHFERSGLKIGTTLAYKLKQVG